MVHSQFVSVLHDADRIEFSTLGTLHTIKIHTQGADLKVKFQWVVPPPPISLTLTHTEKSLSSYPE